jgi:hypothetical protein
MKTREEDRLALLHYFWSVMQFELVRQVRLYLIKLFHLLTWRSGIISSASVTSIFEDLGLGIGNRYVSYAQDEDRKKLRKCRSISILVYTVASVTFQLPATVLVRILGPRLMFFITLGFGLVTMASSCSTFGSSSVDKGISVRHLSLLGSR